MIDHLAQLHWREPLWLGLAAVPLLFLWWQGRQSARLLRYADPELFPWAAHTAAARPRTTMHALMHALAWLLFALAAAGPRVPLELREGQAAPRHLLTVMVVLDVSASMRATDVSPDRLARARLELLDWLPRLQGERVGLIVYAGEAGMLLPPTDDLGLLQRGLDQVDPRLLEAQGTNLAAALDLARAQLAAAAGQARAVLLISDAEADSIDPAAHAAVEALRLARLPLFMLGVGSEAGAPIPLAEGGFAETNGVQVISRMATAPYRQWAQTTGGRFASVSDGDADWAALYDRGLATLPGDAVAPATAVAWRELYPWFLAPALALFMVVWLPRRAAAALALVAVGIAAIPRPASADEAAAWAAWQQQRYTRAQMLYAETGGYRGHMGAGAAAWRQADYAAAQRHFGAALLLADNDGKQADALYNLGNAHYGRGQWRAAVEAFETVLRMQPGHSRARANLEFARQRLRRERLRSPMQSDLGGRRGFLAEGQVQPDGQTGAAPEDPESVPPGVQIDRARSGGPDAYAGGDAAPRGPLTVDSRLTSSGLKKLERLQDRPTSLLRNLLKQDARDQPERPPW